MTLQRDSITQHYRPLTDTETEPLHGFTNDSLAKVPWLHFLNGWSVRHLSVIFSKLAVSLSGVHHQSCTFQCFLFLVRDSQNSEFLLSAEAHARTLPTLSFLLLYHQSLHLFQLCSLALFHFSITPSRFQLPLPLSV